MNRTVIILAAIATFAMGIAVIILGQNLILSLEVSSKRGAGGAWYITWIMVWLTVLCAVALGAFLLKSTARNK